MAFFIQGNTTASNQEEGFKLCSPLSGVGELEIGLSLGLDLGLGLFQGLRLVSDSEYFYSVLSQSRPGRGKL